MDKKNQQALNLNNSNGRGTVIAKYKGWGHNFFYCFNLTLQ